MGSMYKADAMYQEPQPPVTDVMYRMDPLINVPSTEQGQQPKLPNDRRGRLYQRQMKNLANLQHLLTMTNSLLGVGPTGAAPTAPSAAKQGKHGQVQPGADQAAKIKGMSVVVRCKPSNPPYATLLLVEQLKAQGLNVCTPQFWHSSLGAAPDSFKPTGPCASADCDLRLTIIWANDVTETTTTTSAAAGTPLLHDFTAARLIARSFGRFFPADAEAKMTVEDFVDAARSLQTASSKEKKAALKGINMRVGKTGFLCGSDFTVADACLWAATHDPSLSLPSNIKKWAERMSHLPQTAAVDAMVISA